MHAVIQEDLNIALADTGMPWEQLTDKTVLVSGATGLIGKTLVQLLLAYGQAQIVALVRSPEKAKAIFGTRDNLTFVPWQASEPLTYSGSADYIFHCASQTSIDGYA